MPPKQPRHIGLCLHLVGSLHGTCVAVVRPVAEKGQWYIKNGKDRETVVPRWWLLTSHGRIMLV